MVTFVEGRMSEIVGLAAELLFEFSSVLNVKYLVEWFFSSRENFWNKPVNLKADSDGEDVAVV